MPQPHLLNMNDKDTDMKFNDALLKILNKNTSQL